MRLKECKPNISSVKGFEPSNFKTIRQLHRVLCLLSEADYCLVTPLVPFIEKSIKKEEIYIQAIGPGRASI